MRRGFPGQPARLAALIAALTGAGAYVFVGSVVPSDAAMKKMANAIVKAHG